MLLSPAPAGGHNIHKINFWEREFFLLKNISVSFFIKEDGNVFFYLHSKNM